MKKRPNNSARASALQISLSIALLSIAVVLFASSFKAAAPATPNVHARVLASTFNAAGNGQSASIAGGDKGLAKAGPASGWNLFPDPVPLTFNNTGSLNTGRLSHPASLLPNGKVLVAGGDANGAFAQVSAELYDPANGSWSVTGNRAQ